MLDRTSIALVVSVTRRSARVKCQVKGLSLTLRSFLAGGLHCTIISRPQGQAAGLQATAQEVAQPSPKQVPSSSTSAWNTAQAQRTRRITTRLFFCPPLDFLPFLRLAFLTLAFFIFFLTSIIQSLARSKKKSTLLYFWSPLPPSLASRNCTPPSLLCLSIFFNLLVNLTCLAIPPQVTYLLLRLPPFRPNYLFYPSRSTTNFPIDNLPLRLSHFLSICFALLWLCFFKEIFALHDTDEYPSCSKILRLIHRILENKVRLN